jgi:hypothetical protein
MPLPKTEQELERWIAKKLELQNVPLSIWRYLKERQIIHDGIESGTSEYCYEVLRETTALLDLSQNTQGREPARPRKKAMKIEPFLEPEEVARAEVLSRYLAKLAAKDRVVERFRNGALGGGTLAPRDAEAFLAQPAPYLLGFREFEARGIPVRGHHAAVTRTRTNAKTDAWIEKIRLSLTGKGAVAKFRFTVARSSTDGRRLDLPFHLDNRIEQLPVLDGSVFAELRRVALYLEDRFPWNYRDALWFILTDKTPWVQPVQPTYRRRKSADFEHLELSFTVAPWVSAATLSRIVRAHQHALTGGNNRAIEIKTLAFFSFVMERRELIEKPPTWLALMLEWNRTKPARRYTSYNNFRGDYLRLREAVISPGYPFIWVVPR